MPDMIALIEKPETKGLPIVKSVRRMTMVDRLLWRLFTRDAPEPGPQVAYDGLCIRLDGQAIRRLYGLARPAESICEVVQPYPVPPPLREEDLP